ncbi:MAG: hypothetical protein ACYDEY_00950 [Acidimicrobiales bacterium]
MEPNEQNPNGYVRYYNSEGQSLNIYGETGPGSDTHLPLNGEEDPSEDPLSGDFLDLGYFAACGVTV